MSAITPQSGVPIPRRRDGRPVKFPFATMAVGDFFFSPRKSNTLATTASMYGAKLGRTFITRMCWGLRIDDEWEIYEEQIDGAVYGAGCWRVR
jgi:hypothetical protein